MLDVKWIREAPEALDHALRRRGLTPMAERIVALDERRRAAIADSQALQSARNKAAKEIGAAKGRGEDVQPLIARLGADRQAQDAAEVRAAGLESELDALIASLPNPPADDVPDGADADANREVRRVGEPARFNFPARQHDELGALFGLMDFAAAARMSGARFVVLKGALARLERALAQLMLDIHTKEFGYLEISPPLLVRDGAAFGTGQLPKFRDDLFQTTDGFWLIPTAEVPLTNLAADAILEEGDLPLRFTAWTPCFRSEAGAAGKDTRGMIRQHQFSKVELVSIAHPDGSADEHERMTGCAEVILKRLGLPYRVVVLATGDMGFSARKTYDIEVWLPGQNTYREISSCSNCGDFQARRMKARFRAAGQKGTRFVHTLNGSGLAIGRTLIAILENGQRADGSVALPEALHPYMDGRTVIGPHA